MQLHFYQGCSSPSDEPSLSESSCFKTEFSFMQCNLVGRVPVWLEKSESKWVEELDWVQHSKLSTPSCSLANLHQQLHLSSRAPLDPVVVDHIKSSMQFNWCWDTQGQMRKHPKSDPFFSYIFYPLSFIASICQFCDWNDWLPWPCVTAPFVLYVFQSLFHIIKFFLLCLFHFLSFVQYVLNWLDL